MDNFDVQIENDRKLLNELIKLLLLDWKKKFNLN